MYAYMCRMYVPGAQRSQSKGQSGPLELEFKMVVTHYVDVGN